MVLVAQDKLQRVFTRRQFEAGLGLAAAEVTMLVVLGYGLIQRRQGIYIDQ